MPQRVARATRRPGALQAGEALRPRARAEPAAAASSTREQILDAAERLFALRGIDGVAVRDLARETGLTASSLYNHFASKQALYDAVLERGLGPIVEMTAAAWQAGPLEPAPMRVMLDALVGHLAVHRHLAPLLQRVILEDAGRPDSRIAVWVRSLSRQGTRLLRESVGAAGWDEEQVPHLTLALFGLTYSYFVNAAAAHAIEPWGTDPFSPAALATQRQFLEEAVLRLLGPRPGRLTHDRRPSRVRRRRKEAR